MKQRQVVLVVVACLMGLAVAAVVVEVESPGLKKWEKGYTMRAWLVKRNIQRGV